jgi:hypothetical protein
MTRIISNCGRLISLMLAVPVLLACDNRSRIARPDSTKLRPAACVFDSNAMMRVGMALARVRAAREFQTSNQQLAKLTTVENRLTSLIERTLNEGAQDVAASEAADTLIRNRARDMKTFILKAAQTWPVSKQHEYIRGESADMFGAFLQEANEVVAPHGDTECVRLELERVQAMTVEAIASR